jgi:hypothetical protein
MLRTGSRLHFLAIGEAIAARGPRVRRGGEISCTFSGSGDVVEDDDWVAAIVAVDGEVAEVEHALADGLALIEALDAHQLDVDTILTQYSPEMSRTRSLVMTYCWLIDRKGRPCQRICSSSVACDELPYPALTFCASSREVFVDFQQCRVGRLRLPALRAPRAAAALSDSSFCARCCQTRAWMRARVCSIVMVNLLSC